MVNKERIKELRKLRYQNNKDKEKAYYKKWASGNREKVYAYNREYAKRNRQKVERTRRIWRANLKATVLTHYGKGKLACVFCGFDDIRALSIDHINSKGNEERREIKPQRWQRFTGVEFYRWLKKNNYPEGYQTLCMNCQWIKRIAILDENAK